MKKFDSKVWIFILIAAFFIPGYYHIRSIMVGDVQPIYVYVVGVLLSYQHHIDVGNGNCYKK